MRGWRGSQELCSKHLFYEQLSHPGKKYLLRPATQWNTTGVGHPCWTESGSSLIDRAPVHQHFGGEFLVPYGPLHRCWVLIQIFDGPVVGEERMPKEVREFAPILNGPFIEMPLRWEFYKTHCLLLHVNMQKHGTEQGLQVLGAPIGSLAYIEAALARTTAKHAVLFDRITAVPDLQCAYYLLLTYCANTRATYLLRALPPILTQAFARAHDEAAAATLAHLLGHGAPGLPHAALARPRLPFRCGGLGLQSAAGHPGLTPCPPCKTAYQASLTTSSTYSQGKPEPSPLTLTQPAALPPPSATPGSRCPPGRPSLRRPHHIRMMAAYPIRPVAGNVPHVTPETTPSSQRSFLPSTQPGAHSCCPRPARTLAGLSPHSPRPSSSASRTRSSGSSCCDASDPPTAHTCSCRRPLDALGDHRAACAQAGVLRSRAVPEQRKRRYFPDALHLGTYKFRITELIGP